MHVATITSEGRRRTADEPQAPFAQITADELLKRLERNWPEAATADARLFIPLYRLRELMWLRAEKSARSQGLAPSELDVLAALRAGPPPHRMRPTELMTALLLSSGGLTKVLYGLERKQLVKRRANRDDRRSLLVQLTAKGAALAERTLGLIQARDRALLKNALGEDEITQLASLVHRLLRQLEPSIES